MPSPGPDGVQPPPWKRLGRFPGIALASTGATAVVAYALKALLV